MVIKNLGELSLVDFHKIQDTLRKFQPIHFTSDLAILAKVYWPIQPQVYLINIWTLEIWIHLECEEMNGYPWRFSVLYSWSSWTLSSVTGDFADVTKIQIFIGRDKVCYHWFKYLGLFTNETRKSKEEHMCS